MRKQSQTNSLRQWSATPNGIGGTSTAPRTLCTASVWTAVFLFTLAGCAGSTSTSGDVSHDAEKLGSPKVAKTEIERGPVKVSVEVEPHPARLSDEPVMTLTIDYVRDVQIDKPPFGEAIGDFIIRDYREMLPAAENEREIIRQIYTLEPTRTGTLQIAPITVTFTDNRPEGDGEKHTVQTAAVAVEVNSVLESDAPSLEDLQGLTGPVELPVDRDFLSWWPGGLLLILAAAAVAIWKLRRRRGPEEELERSPQEWAYLDLQRLVQENLSETDVKLFYVHLTGIVRRYIERTTQIHAPEQTTEEFLQEISAGDAFPPADQQRLKSFLESADIVKFAAYQPTPDNIEQAFGRAKVFVGLEAGAPVPAEAVTS